MTKWFKKFFLTILLMFASLSTIVLTTSLIVSCSSNNSEPSKSTLTNDEVQSNFLSGNKWDTRSFLTYQDFNNYSSINIDAFDNISNSLDYIELPSSIKINADNTKPILWSTVKEIRVYNDGNQNICSINNIIFIKQKLNNFGDCYIANTITNRYNAITIEFPKNVNNLPYEICNYFYNQSIFNNVKKITFDNQLSILDIGVSAFENCNLFDSVIELNFNLIKPINIFSIINLYMLKIEDSAFKNTNLQELSIDYCPKSDTKAIMVLCTIGKGTFSNNQYLTTFKYVGFNDENGYYGDFNTFVVDVCEEAFLNSPLQNIVFISDALALGKNSFSLNNQTNSLNQRNVLLFCDTLQLEDSIFCGKYSKYNLIISPYKQNTIDFNSNPSSLSSIDWT